MYSLNFIPFNETNSKQTTFKILSIPKERRSSQEIEYLYNEFKNIEFMKSFNRSDSEIILTNILKYITLKKYDEGEVIYRKGDNASYCYLIISGLIELSQPRLKMSFNSSKSNLLNEKEKSVIENSGRTVTFNTKNNSVNLPYSYSRISLSKEKNISESEGITILYEGQIFGENEIIEKKKRNYTAKAVSHCYLGEISKIDYCNIFENIKRLERNEEIKFLQSVDSIRNSNRSTQNKIKQIFRKKLFKLWDIVARQNSVVEYVYLIKKGNFEVIYEENVTYSTDYNLNYFIKLNSENERFTSQRAYELKNSYKENETSKLLILGPGEFFGITEFKNNERFYNLSLICISSQGEVMICKKDDFLSLSMAFISKIFAASIIRENHLLKRIVEIVNKRDLFSRNKYNKLIINKTSDKKQENRADTGSDDIIKNTIADVISNKKKRAYSIVGSLVEIKHKLPKRINSPVSVPSTIEKFTSTYYNSSIETEVVQTDVNTLENITRVDERNSTILTTPNINGEKHKRIMSAQPPNYSRSKYDLRSTITSLQTIAVDRQNLPSNNTHSSIDMPKAKSILSENEKGNFMKCFEINKKFLLNNNTSKIYTNLSKYYIGSEIPFRKQNVP